MLKNIFSLAAIVAVCTMLAGCPYTSSVPLDKPSVKVNEKLYGTWKASSSDDTKYKVDPKDDYTYTIVKKAKGSNDEKYCAYISMVNGVSFLNLYTDDGTDEANRQYYIYRLDIKGDGVFNLKEVTENIDEEFTSSEELKKFVETNMNNSYFYDKSEDTYTKQ